MSSSFLSRERGAWSARDVPRSVWFALGALALYWLLLIYQLGAQWSLYEQYNYGWSVPFLCAYLIWQRVQNSAFGVQSSKFAFLSTLRSSLSALTFSFSLLLFACLLLYLPTRFVHEANPVWRLTSLLWTVEVISLTLLVIRLAFGLKWLRQLAFPICFFVLAVPWLYPIETFFLETLTRLNVGATIELLGLFGVPAVQHANVIEIGTGMVGIDEACSGIRSFQATLMISLFLGEFYRLSVVRRAVCVVGGFFFAFVFNVGRTLLLTRIAAAKGTGAVAAWHDPAGITILVACFASLWLFAVALKRRKTGKEDTRSESNLFPMGGRIANLLSPLNPAAALRTASFLLVAWFILVEGATQVFYRFHEHAGAGFTNWTLRLPPGYQNKDVPKLVSMEFKYDDGFEGEWDDQNNAHWQLFYFRWEPARSLKRRVVVQRVKMHGPETCLPQIGMTLKSDLGVRMITTGDLKLAIQHYVFEVEGQPLHVFFGIYEDQTGSTVLANRRIGTASRIEAALSGSRNYGQRFVEIAVHGYDSAEDAEAAVSRELAPLVKVSK
jgi:exosortase